jgi:DNA-3-methyladenine glycosylase II
MRRIETLDHIAEGIAALGVADPRLLAVIATAGEIPLRRQPPGFEGLTRIIISQQVSVASAAAIWGRVQARIAPYDAEVLLAVPEAELKACGLSGGKIKTITGIARAIAAKDIDLEHIADLDPLDAHAMMTKLHGVGPWTADIFLLFCAGHPDIWPGGDLALQQAVMEAFALEARPAEKLCRSIAESWQPWRSVAARLFWAYYKAVRDGRNALPV